jgi:hypothetical protein
MDAGQALMIPDPPLGAPTTVMKISPRSNGDFHPSVRLLKRGAALLAATTALLLASTIASVQGPQGASGAPPASVQGLGPQYFVIVFRPGPHWIA